MKHPRRLALVIALAGGLVLPFVGAAAASGHGWVDDPPSRQDYCSQGLTSFDCGQVEYEPQSVEAPKGSLRCSGGNPAFAILDDATKPWPRKGVDDTVTIQWHLTARHATESWEYFVDGALWKRVNDFGAQPAATVQHILTGLPAGEHTILARWNVADTTNAFYSCIDVNVGGPSSGGGSGDDCPVAWQADQVYTAGQQASSGGRTWAAKWWTRGEVPGSGGEWGAWRDLGPCPA
ncbi:lytic polysaccharide monooxygenase [Agromyces sp. H3Y2-19a]|uniref:lytic polysaccharide monooxygenase n=1 Tax=Agromyces chromiiresistens TaxID=3030835 RepID=UPI0023BA15E6|nr:lytic polysaccharide monooxygenase [Agromyces chromiiresistens]MDF0514825.1 lytic polysaccharide monooxygenase [Agromyces chromiiresistens]